MSYLNSLLTSQGRIGRVKYFLNNIVITFMVSISSIVFAAAGPLAIIPILLSFYLVYCNTSRRLNDIYGVNNGKEALAFFFMILFAVPGVNLAISIYLMIRTGRDDNYEHFFHEHKKQD